MHSQLLPPCLDHAVLKYLLATFSLSNLLDRTFPQICLLWSPHFFGFQISSGHTAILPSPPPLPPPSPHDPPAQRPVPGELQAPFQRVLDADVLMVARKEARREPGGGPYSSLCCPRLLLKFAPPSLFFFFVASGKQKPSIEQYCLL